MCKRINGLQTVHRFCMLHNQLNDWVIQRELMRRYIERLHKQPTEWINRYAYIYRRDKHE
jgi:hypothetical protein